MDGLFIPGLRNKEELEKLIQSCTRGAVKAELESILKAQQSADHVYGGVVEVKRKTGLSAPTIYKYVELGVLKAKRVGKRLLIDLTYIDENLNEIQSLKGRRR